MGDELKPIDFASYPVLPYWTKVRGPLFEILATIKNRVDRDLRAELERDARPRVLVARMLERDLEHPRAAIRLPHELDAVDSVCRQHGSDCSQDALPRETVQLFVSDAHG